MSRSIWHTDQPPRAASELPSAADVVVVGGGLSGVWLALALAEAGRPPLVLERSHLAAGASGRNGGLLLPGTAELYPALIARHGRVAARDLWRWAVAGAADFVATIDRYSIDCDWRPEGALHAADSAAEASALATAADLLAEDGFPGTWLPPEALLKWLDVPLPPQVHGALVLPDGGAFHSGRLLVGLAAAAASRGATFIEGIDVRAISRPATDSPLSVQTERGPISAEIVIVATNAWLPELLPSFAQTVVPVRGQVLATEPLPERIFRGAWSLNDGYEYLQQLTDGRIVFGGLRWTVPDREVGRLTPDVTPTIQTGLDAWLTERFPSLNVSVERRWAGPMCWTSDRLPLVGPVPGGAEGGTDHDHEHGLSASATAARTAARTAHGTELPSPSSARLWVAAAYNGHGVPITPAAARLVASALTGGSRTSTVARYLDPARALAPVAGSASP